MSSLAEEGPLSTMRPRVAWAMPALFSIAAVACVILIERLPTIGFAYLNVDESAYLAIGEAMLHGAVPYVDIVDRKPVGLYLIYALAVAIFPDPIIGARVLGLLCTGVSAAFIAGIARRHLQESRACATLAATLFSCYAILYGGDAAQYNVFIMPFVAAAAWIVFENLARISQGLRPQVLLLGAAGLLLGLAMQIKYTPAFEAIGFGILLIAAGWRYRAALGLAGLRALLAGLGLMIAGGLAPTLAAAAAYWRMGLFDVFMFYNFTVNVVRPATDYLPGLLAFRIAEACAIAAPLTAFSIRYAARLRAGPYVSISERWVQAGLAVWFAAAVFGALVQRQPYLHYFYAIVPPLALWAAGALVGRFGLVRPKPWIAALIIPAFIGYAGGWIVETISHGSAYLPREVAQTLRAERVRSLYVFNYFGVLYHLSGLPSPTRYTLPTHLLRDLEAASFQFDAKSEVGRILESEPQVVVVARPFAANIAPDRVALLDAALNKGYCTWRTYPAGRDTVYLYRFRGIVGDAARACSELDDVRPSGTGTP